MQPDFNLTSTYECLRLLDIQDKGKNYTNDKFNLLMFHVIREKSQLPVSLAYDSDRDIDCKFVECETSSDFNVAAKTSSDIYDDKISTKFKFVLEPKDIFNEDNQAAIKKFENKKWYLLGTISTDNIVNLYQYKCNHTAGLAPRPIVDTIYQYDPSKIKEAGHLRKIDTKCLFDLIYDDIMKKTDEKLSTTTIKFSRTIDTMVQKTNIDSYLKEIDDYLTNSLLINGKNGINFSNTDINGIKYLDKIVTNDYLKQYLYSKLLLEILQIYENYLTGRDNNKNNNNLDTSAASTALSASTSVQFNSIQKNNMIEALKEILATSGTLYKTIPTSVEMYFKAVQNNLSRTNILLELNQFVNNLAQNPVADYSIVDFIELSSIHDKIEVKPTELDIGKTFDKNIVTTGKVNPEDLNKAAMIIYDLSKLIFDKLHDTKKDLIYIYGFPQNELVKQKAVMF